MKQTSKHQRFSRITGILVSASALLVTVESACAFDWSRREGEVPMIHCNAKPTDELNKPNNRTLIFTTDPGVEHPNAMLEYYCNYDTSNLYYDYYTCELRGGSEGSIYQLQGENKKSGLGGPHNASGNVNPANLCQAIYFAMGVWAKTK